ncbi:hypothetical protein COB11_07335 [Candidatus Aerophobetes bacterium]|uniref:Uncharacterized protein n=1 Tax=Aerophobetes bacterium TaxID=2030807 RepID=A0A2A4YC66_UNCAE|nr:MAG: hypothetical protein COB11_07335 [Candidatus Aerophobetes bacterium]
MTTPTRAPYAGANHHPVGLLYPGARHRPVRPPEQNGLLRKISMLALSVFSFVAFPTGWNVGLGLAFLFLAALPSLGGRVSLPRWNFGSTSMFPRTRFNTSPTIVIAPPPAAFRGADTRVIHGVGPGRHFGVRRGYVPTGPRHHVGQHSHHTGAVTSLRSPLAPHGGGVSTGPRHSVGSVTTHSAPVTPRSGISGGQRHHVGHK